MGSKKYLNRKKEQKISADDEWAHLTGIEKGPKLEVSDALDIQSRNIFVAGTKPKASFYNRYNSRRAIRCGTSNKNN